MLDTAIDVSIRLDCADAQWSDELIDARAWLELGVSKPLDRTLAALADYAKEDGKAGDIARAILHAYGV